MSLTMTEASKLIDKYYESELLTDKLWVHVNAIDAREVYGRVNILVRPTNGRGSIWVTEERLQTRSV